MASIHGWKKEVDKAYDFGTWFCRPGTDESLLRDAALPPTDAVVAAVNEDGSVREISMFMLLLTRFCCLLFTPCARMLYNIIMCVWL